MAENAVKNAGNKSNSIWSFPTCKGKITVVVFVIRDRKFTVIEDNYFYLNILVNDVRLKNVKLKSNTVSELKLKKKKKPRFDIWVRKLLAICLKIRFRREKKKKIII